MTDLMLQIIERKQKARELAELPVGKKLRILEKMIERAKLALLQPYWKDSWGSLPAFRQWVLNDFSEPPPSNTEEARRLFNYGKK